MPRTTRTRWVGDLRTCFLHDEGWAFRLEVNRFLLAGREGWRLPLSFAQHIGLADAERRSLKPNRPELADEVWIMTRSDACLGGPIDRPLRRLGATPGDLVFFSVRGDRYSMRLRRRGDWHDESPLKKLLWSCGLDPTDPAVLSEPWLLLSRALGGSGNRREDVRYRLDKRGDDGLLGLLTVSERSPIEHAHDASRPWPDGWQYRLPLADHASLVALKGGDQTTRVALGVLDATNHPPRELLLGDGNTLWLQQSVVADPDDLLETLRAPPRGLVPTAHRRGWTRMLRVEHVARRLALSGHEWTVAVLDAQWQLDGQPYGSVLDALEALDDPGDELTPAPSRGVQNPYPRSVVALRGAAEDAITAGLRAIVADPVCGFRAEYVGRQVTGAALHEILRTS
jgi:hypothetical protein